MKIINCKIAVCFLSIVVTAGSFSMRPSSAEASEVPVIALDTGASLQLIDIDYRDVDIKEIARAFSEISGKNIIVSDEAKANVTLKMEKVNWKTALEVILDTYNLAYIEKENFIIITTAERRRLQEESGTLETKIVRLNFVKVSDIQGTLTSMLTGRGKINIDERTNSLIITDIKERINDIEEVALKLDTRTPQVLIETLIVDVKLTDAFKWGVMETLANNIKDPNAAGSNKWKLASNALTVTGGATAMWGNPVLKSADLDLTLQSIITNTETKILANPRIVTLDNLAAIIDIVTKKPYQTTGQAAGGGTLTTTEYLDIGIKLEVTPHITKDNFISAEVSTEYGAESGSTSALSPPTVDSRKASTNVLVKDGETIVLGGLRRRDVTFTKAKIPLLADIPLLGNLFKKHDESVIETELVIFITLHLVGDTALGDRERIQLEEMKNMRELSADTVSFKDKELLPIRAPVKIK